MLEIIKSVRIKITLVAQPRLLYRSPRIFVSSMNVFRIAHENNPLPYDSKGLYLNSLFLKKSEFKSVDHDSLVSVNFGVMFKTSPEANVR